jgi:hypothetical protein
MIIAVLIAVVNNEQMYLKTDFFTGKNRIKAGFSQYSQAVL